MAKLVDALDLGSSAAMRESSSLSIRTKFRKSSFFRLLFFLRLKSKGVEWCLIYFFTNQKPRRYFGHKMDTIPNKPQKENRLNDCLDGLNLAPRAGLEPATCGLTVRRSTD